MRTVLTSPVELIVQAIDARMVPAMPVAPAGDSATPVRLVTAVQTAVATDKPAVVVNTNAAAAGTKTTWAAGPRRVPPPGPRPRERTAGRAPDRTWPPTGLPGHATSSCSPAANTLRACIT